MIYGTGDVLHKIAGVGPYIEHKNFLLQIHEIWKIYGGLYNINWEKIKTNFYDISFNEPVPKDWLAFSKWQQQIQPPGSTHGTPIDHFPPDRMLPPAF